MSVHRNKSVNVHQFSMIPKAAVPRASFRIQKTHKTTLDAGYLYPVYIDEVLPGDTHSCRMTAFCRMSTPIFPILDNAYLETFFFFVPCRLLWTNWVKFMGEQANPGDSIAYTVPVVTSPSTGYAVGSLQDYMGLPTVGQLAGANTYTHNVLPCRAYNQIFNEWFRDENLVSATPEIVDDGPDTAGGTQYLLKRRGKRHDYFTSCLPWTQKGGVAISIPLGTSAPVKTQASDTVTGAQSAMNYRNTAGSSIAANFLTGVTSSSQAGTSTAGTMTLGVNLYPSNLYTDLSVATAATINQLRQSFQIQRLLERDARGGTRYTELVRAHFGVVSPDARLQRPEYIGGGQSPLAISAVPQTSATGLTGGNTPIGNLAAFGTVLGHGHSFTYSATEHGYIIGLLNIRADLTYQQGVRKMWNRSTRYDFYMPVFANLGEQAVLNKEIYADGSANDNNVFGYQERWAEYRYNPSMITGRFKSTSASTIDNWHLAQKFTSLPVLDNVFIAETPPFSRVLAAGAAADTQQFLCDLFFDNKCARPMPLYSVPGLIDHL